MDIGRKKFNERVSEMLCRMMVTPNLCGFRYIIDSEYYIVKKHCKVNVMYEIYNSVAEDNKTTAKRVERAIRHLVDGIYDKGNVRLINTLIKVEFYHLVKPTNNQFLMFLGEMLSREFYVDDDGNIRPIE